MGWNWDWAGFAFEDLQSGVESCQGSKVGCTFVANLNPPQAMLAAMVSSARTFMFHSVRSDVRKGEMPAEHEDSYIEKELSL
jgi:hypothetical protein